MSFGASFAVGLNVVVTFSMWPSLSFSRVIFWLDF